MEQRHDIALCREVLVIHPFQFEHGTRDRGQCWDKRSKNLNSSERPRFMVDQRAVRDCICKLQKDFKRKRAHEERASGICPDEPDDLEQALEEMSEMEESQQEQLKIGEDKRRLVLQKEKETAESMRKRAMERMGETRARENVEREGKRRKCGTEAVDYVREKREQERKIKEDELELRKREIDMQEKRAEEKMIIRGRELEMKEREHNVRERELEEQFKREQDIIFVLKPQIQQQHAILEQVQQQNKLLLSLYQHSLQKKE